MVETTPKVQLSAQEAQKFPIMQSAFTEMLKEGKKVWLGNIQRNANADFRHGFSQLFRYYNLTAEQSKLLAETVSAIAADASTQASSGTDSNANAERSYSGDKGLVNLELTRNTPIEKKPVAECSYGQRIRIAKLHESHEPYMDHIIQVCGWARTCRSLNKNVFVVELHDGSCADSVQVVIDSTMPNYADIITCKPGASFKMRGKLVASPSAGQVFDLQVCHPESHAVTIFGKCDPTKFPLAGKDHSLEYLREIAHMRPRTRFIAAMTRVRNNLSYATHKFFQERGFQYIHTPLITASDCEGAGEMFQVTTALPDPDKPVVDVLPLISYKGQEEAENAAAEALKNPVKKPKAVKAKAKIVPNPNATAEDLAACEAQKNLVIAIKKDKARKDETPAALAEWDRLKALCEIKIEAEEVAEEVKPEEAEKEMIPLNERKMNYRKDFFDKPAYLTVSGQLAVENYNCAMGDVYTFGPTFRAENSNTSRHLAEFWMIEPEIAFADLNDNMNLAEDYLKYCLRYVLVNNADDIQFFTELESKDKKKSKDRVFDTVLKKRLEQVADTPFKRISYTDCIAVLEEHMKSNKVTFKEKPAWGCDMGSEHERYLAEKVYNMPIIVYNYPKDFKAFYMKANEDGKTCQAMDILVPAIGELMGGSVREEDLGRLDAAIKEKGLELEPYWWYRELRMYGTQPHAGFGLGFERLVMMCTGIENIRDVIPFPRVPGHAEF